MDVGKIIGKLLGNKADRDMTEVMPYVDKIKETYKTIEGISSDELRERSEALKARVTEYVEKEKTPLRNLKQKLKIQNFLLRKRKLYTKRSIVWMRRLMRSMR